MPSILVVQVRAPTIIKNVEPYNKKCLSASLCFGFGPNVAVKSNEGFGMEPVSSVSMKRNACLFGLAETCFAFGGTSASLLNGPSKFTAPTF